MHIYGGVPFLITFLNISRVSSNDSVNVVDHVGLYPTWLEAVIQFLDGQVREEVFYFAVPLFRQTHISRKVYPYYDNSLRIFRPVEILRFPKFALSGISTTMKYVEITVCRNIGTVLYFDVKMFLALNIQ